MQLQQQHLVTSQGQLFFFNRANNNLERMQDNFFNTGIYTRLKNLQRQRIESLPKSCKQTDYNRFQE